MDHCSICIPTKQDYTLRLPFHTEKIASLSHIHSSKQSQHPSFRLLVFFSLHFSNDKKINPGYISGNRILKTNISMVCGPARDSHQRFHLDSKAICIKLLDCDEVLSFFPNNLDREYQHSVWWAVNGFVDCMCLQREEKLWFCAVGHISIANSVLVKLR